ncbi:MAG: arginine--tRNA ligase [Eubacterium coprostanoligenes]|uniref:arginine--tRNA ligase n=1 Tax=Eubacterium coprostanoligenes TaxID=290054 RepID=UPI002A7FD9EB|nr:arginine--tRNA ligase [Eubacterium coprostanoligenes]MDY4698607.1 arginine--tRNA ligase [Eubacterium coprostanoligenes]MDY5377178.1 arginine--tRNA ligase [Eubacterium coprostanoligenes]
MSKMVKEVENKLNEAIALAVEKATQSGDLPEAEMPKFIIEKPADKKNGDFSSNIAMAGARAYHQAPRMIAEAIVKNFSLDGGYIDRCEIAGPGFINFYLSDKYYSDVLKDIVSSGDNYGRSDYGEGKKMLVEFVSANPTGPMHIGNARGGAIGDCLASVLDAAGYDVQREFYINDAGNQIEKFATSLEVRYLQECGKDVELPEDAYHGEDITVHARNFYSEVGDKYAECDSQERRDALVAYALPKNIAGLEADLGKYRIKYDKWFRESTLHNDGSVQKIIEALKEKGVTYEQDGALWFKASEFGNDKDIVLIRANGIPTYIVPDIAYHYNKLVTRGYDKAIDVLGADHHGYIPRMKAALTALGLDANRLDIVIMQMVRLVRNGETIKLSKRSGKAITLNTLLEEVPIDAARFFFNLREPNSHFDFDLELAAKQSSENPVYYVQYAHARICSIIKKAADEGIGVTTPSEEALNRLNSSEERDLISHLASLTDEIIGAAKSYDPARITHYVIELATLFHKFYNAHRVVSDDKELTEARLFLCTAVKNTIKNILVMLKVDVPESM